MSDLESTRQPRFLVLVLLVVLIGALGALVLSPLLHEPGRPAPQPVDASIAFVLDAEGALPGWVHLHARRPDVPPLLAAEACPRHMSADAIAGFLHHTLEEGGWRGVSTRGPGLALDGVLEIGVGVGATGAGFEVSLAARGSQGTPYRIQVREVEQESVRSGAFGPGGEVVEDAPPARSTAPTASVTILGVRAGQDPSGPADAHETRMTLPIARAGASLPGDLARALIADGWSVDHPVPAPDHLWIRALPSGSAPSRLMVSVAYDVAPGEAPLPLLWIVGVE